MCVDITINRVVKKISQLVKKKQFDFSEILDITIFEFLRQCCYYVQYT